MSDPQDVLDHIRRNRSALQAMALPFARPVALGIFGRRPPEATPTPEEVESRIEQHRARLGAFAAEVGLITGRDPLHDRDDNARDTPDREPGDQR